MRRWIIAVALLLAPLAQAQNADAPDPAVDNPIVYAHGNADDDEVLWMNADEDDPDATDTANGPGYTCTVSGEEAADDAYCTAEGMAGVGVSESEVESFEHTFSIPLDPHFDADVPFDAGDIVFTVAFGASSGEGSGEAVARLLAGEEVLAETDPFPFEYAEGYEQFEATATPTVDALPGGTDLTWEIEASGEASGFFLGVHDDTARSFFELPFPGATDEVTVQYHDAADRDLTASFQWNGTAQHHQYNWSQGPGEAVLFVQGNVSGNATVVVTDAADATLFNQTLTGAVQVSESLNGTAGNWTVTVEAQAEGNLSVALGPPGIDAPADDGDTDDDPDGSDEDGDDTEGAAEDDTGGNGTAESEDSPGPGALMVLALAAAAFALRRR